MATHPAPIRPRTVSPWRATVASLEFPRLDADLTADACVVGAGIAGLTTAYLLALDGRSVVVLDNGPVAGAMSGSTSGHLASAIDDRILQIEHVHGEEGARLAVQSHGVAIERIRAIVRAEGIGCGFEHVDGYLSLGPGDEVELLDRELEAARRAGFFDVERLERVPGAPFDTGPCLRFPRQAQFHPVRYLNGLALAIERLGGRIHCGTHVSHVAEGDPVVVEAAGRTVTAKNVVIATNSPIHPRLAIHSKQAPCMTYVIGIGMRPGAVPPMLLWDTGMPYHYVRVMEDPALMDITRGGRALLLVGGEDHRTGEDGDAHGPYDALETWARHRFPMLENVEFAWCGQFFEPADHLAFIGRSPGRENIFVVTGDSGQGLTHGTAGGILISDLIAGRPNPWEHLYDPSRVTLRAGGALARQNLETIKRYGAWLAKGDVESPDCIAPGCGAVLVRGMKRIASYRDPAGRLHECSATCPHLGGVVHWNAAASTWDCPCHGSRFDPLGKILSGPASSNLKPVRE
jgi:glycine/D-amino acid oxidase-like deaminating enzyme/nitrite reductase/ring-hydroxylating ferredoxin subunit